MAEAAPHHIECAICLDYVNPDEDKLVNLKTCGHVFHDQCIRAWVNAGKYDQDYTATNKKCPMCQTRFSQTDIQPIFIQTKKAEQSEEIMKELEKVREQLKKEKEKAADSANSALVDPMVQMVAKMRLIETSTSQRAVFMPNCRHVLFEGCQGLEDSVAFKDYTGQRNWHHQRLRCYKPELVTEPGLGRDTIHNSLMNTVFSQQMAVVKQTYDESKDGRLELTVKFGRVYIFKAPGPRQMLVRDFNYGIGIQHKKSDPQAVCTSFTPIETPSERIIRQLVDASFTETGQEDVVVVNIDHSKQRPRIQFEVYLTSDLRFRSLRQNDRSFVNIDIRRKEEARPDVRLAVKSVDEEFEKEKLKLPAKNYARDNLVRKDPIQPHRLLIDKSAIGKVSYVRKKVSKVFRLHRQPTTPTTGLEKYLDVKLIDTTSFEDPQYNGTFKRMKQQVEVYVRISGKDELFKACDDPAFLQKLLEFCNKFA